MSDSGCGPAVIESPETATQALRDDSLAVPRVQTKEEDQLNTSSVNENESEGPVDKGRLHPSLRWFIAIAFPLLAGTFGPIANLFSVCAVTQSWRQYLLDRTHVPDPSWLIWLKSISLVLALCANLLLLLNFAHRVRYSVAQALTITLWYISGILLIVPLSLVRNHDQASSTQPTYFLSQSFYSAVIAAIVYLVISTLLLLNSAGAYVFHAYPPTFDILAIPQRAVMIQTMLFSLYLALGSGVFSSLEGWAFVDGIYWADYTILTIGLGTDFPLHKTASRALLIPYAAIGITIVGLLVTNVRGLLLERTEPKLWKRRLRKERKKWSNVWDKKWPIIVGDKHVAGRGQGVWDRAEFELMRHIEQAARKSERYVALGMSILVFVFLWVGGALVFWSCESRGQNWTYMESLYFSYTSLLTLGYGDFFPTSQAGKPFFVIWTMLSIPAITVLISCLGDTVAKGARSAGVWVWKGSGFEEKDQHRKSKLKRWKSFKRQGHASATETGTHPLKAEVTFGRDVEHVDHASERSEGRNETGRKLTARLFYEIRSVARDIGRQQRYQWDDWNRWLHLLGEGHEARKGRKTNESRPRSSTPPTGSLASAAPSPRGEPAQATSDTRGVPYSECDWHWSWVGDDGPLFSKESEAEWVLWKLSSCLEGLLDAVEEDSRGRSEE